MKQSKNKTKNKDFTKKNIYILPVYNRENETQLFKNNQWNQEKLLKKKQKKPKKNHSILSSFHNVEKYISP